MTIRRDLTAAPRAAENMPGCPGAGHPMLVAEQTASDRDQSASDADQTASDADQTASERDDERASRDQESADRDQASADRQHRAQGGGAADEAYASSRAARDASRVDRLATHSGRASTAEVRLGTARGRDRTAVKRDAIALERDERAASIEDDIVASGAPVRQKVEWLREQAGKDRARAAADRRRSAADRAEAAGLRARLAAELHGAYLDAVTGAFRRDFGRLALSLEIDRSRRGDGRFVLAFVDVDGLKSVNDAAGHTAGDHVLRTLVATMRANLRSFDAIVRFGGDEFLCGIGGTEPVDVARRFGVIGASLRADTNVGISVGLAVLRERETLDDITARADATLVEAKRSRRASAG